MIVLMSYISHDFLTNLSVYNVHARHMFLFETIGYLEEEHTAYITSLWILFGSLAYIMVATLLASICFNLYNNKFHPFSDILKVSEGMM